MCEWQNTVLFVICVKLKKRLFAQWLSFCRVSETDMTAAAVLLQMCGTLPTAWPSGPDSSLLGAYASGVLLRGSKTDCLMPHAHDRPLPLFYRSRLLPLAMCRTASDPLAHVHDLRELRSLSGKSLQIAEMPFRK